MIEKVISFFFKKIVINECLGDEKFQKSRFSVLNMAKPIPEHSNKEVQSFNLKMNQDGDVFICRNFTRRLVVKTCTSGKYIYIFK